jgi:hypothetical protein
MCIAIQYTQRKRERINRRSEQGLREANICDTLTGATPFSRRNFQGYNLFGRYPDESMRAMTGREHPLPSGE